jgi:hypothetical protein
MRRAWTVLFGMALGAAMLGAQSAGRSYGVAGMESAAPGQSAGQQPSANTLTMTMVRIDSGCPVSMRAQHLAGGEMVKTGKANPQGTGQWLHLTLMASGSRRIAKATLTIRGSSGNGRVMKAAGSGDGSPDARTTVTAQFAAGPEGHDVADLWAPGLTAVESIEVDSVEYADGSRWKLDDQQACRVTPDPLMRVAGR